MADPFRLEGRIVAVIGAGSGIGAACAQAAATQGAHVVCLDVNEAGAAATAAAIIRGGGAAAAAPIDITDAAQTDAALAHIKVTHGRLDGLVCTPSINVRKTLLNYSEAEFDRVVSVNLKGSFNAVRAAGTVMVPQGAGSIVVFSSIRAVAVEPGQSVYAMTKAGVVQLVRGAACEFGTAGVRVNALAPGVVETPLTAPIRANREWYDAYASKSILRRWAQPDEIAGPTVFLLTDALRLAGVAAEMDHQGRSLKSQFKLADRLGARYVVIVGTDEVATGQVTVRDMVGGSEERVEIRDLTSTVLQRLAR